MIVYTVSHLSNLPLTGRTVETAREPMEAEAVQNCHSDHAYKKHHFQPLVRRHKARHREKRSWERE